jgi:hypothetical protein
VVGLVEDDDLGPVEPNRAALEVVEQAARRGDEDVDAAGQRADLRVVLHAADDDGDRRADVPAVGLEAGRDLGGELARRGQDQCPGRFRLQGLLVGDEQAMQDRQREGRGLAGAGLGDAEQVAARHHRRDRLDLDGGGGGVALGLKGTKKGFGEAEVSKSGQESTFKVDRKQQPRGQEMQRPGLRSGAPRIWAAEVDYQGAQQIRCWFFAVGEMHPSRGWSHRTGIR